MPRFFFDVYDGGFFPDDEGREHADVAAARKEAMSSLPEIARWLAPKNSDNQSYMVMIRDQSGAAVYTATLAFSAHLLERGQADPGAATHSPADQKQVPPS